MTIQEQFMVTQTEVMLSCKRSSSLLNSCRTIPVGKTSTANLESPAMKPPTFEEAKEPLAANAWIRAIEAKFSVFTLPCSEEHKASFAALQLCVQR
jgi:hypothetical protein